MAVFTLEEVCLATGGISQNINRSLSFSSISTDTRKIEPGSLFIALTGERFDGHEFVCQAVEKGAAGVVVSKPVSIDKTAAVIVVNNTLQALQDLAAFHRLRYNIPVIAVTGSNGKTTTKDMIAAVLGARISVLKTEANFNNEIGLPLTLLKLTAEHQAAVVEMGMRGIGEIAALAKIARPTIGVVTNVGESHLERLGSREAIAEAKAELVQSVGKDGVVILNADNSYVKAMRYKTAAPVVYYGTGSEADVKAVQVESWHSGASFICQTHSGDFPVHLSVPGRHNVYNALAAIAVGLELKLEPSDIAGGLAGFTSGRMRLYIEQHEDCTVINDAYNASPLSMGAAIETMADISKGRKIAVLGDMLELGDYAVPAHRDIGKKLGQCKVDAVITVGSLSRYIAESAGQAGVEVAIACDNHEQAKAALKNIMQPGDTLLIKGSRGMQMEKILEMF